MRGGLDDALDKLARRDELRRRAAGEASGTPPAVQELVEAIAAVVGHNPRLAVTVGVEGAGEPLLLHFAVEDGTVQVSADPTVAARAAEVAPASPRHADFDIDLDDTAEEPKFTSTPSAYAEPSAYTEPVSPAFSEPASGSYAERPYVERSYSPLTDTGESTRRISYDDRDRYDPGTGYEADLFDGPPPPPEPRYERHHRFGDTTTTEPARHPFAATPPPQVPPQTTRRIHAEQHRAPEERPAHERVTQRGMPAPLPEPIPLKVDSKETEQAARRLAALLRDNPTLLRPSSSD